MMFPPMFCGDAMEDVWRESRNGRSNRHLRARARVAGHTADPWERGLLGGRERFLDPGDLPLVLLRLLADQPSYGYELIKTIDARLAGGYAPSPGVVYPTLAGLEERGLAHAQTGARGRKIYSITPAGRQELATQNDRLREITARLDHTGRVYHRSRSPQIVQAFQVLGEAVRRRLLRPDITPHQIARIGEVIEAAANYIDKI